MNSILKYFTSYFILSKTSLKSLNLALRFKYLCCILRFTINCTAYETQEHFQVFYLFFQFLKKWFIDVSLFLGVGIATMVLVFFLDIYYCVIIAWTIFYMIATFTAIPKLPWDTCGKFWSPQNATLASGIDVGPAFINFGFFRAQWR